MLNSFFKNVGPGPLIAAAFIGPGTITMCSIAGAQFKYALIWALLVSILLTMFIQLTAIRIGLISKNTLSNLIKDQFQNGLLKSTSILLIISAIFIGNSAYEAGNISYRLKHIGPGSVVAAAFIGPGTITTVSYTHLTLPTNREV